MMIEASLNVRAAIAQSGLVPVDAHALLCHVLGVDRAWLVAHELDPIPRAGVEAFFALTERRRAGEPIAYLVGRREFWGLDLEVNPAVLIPRPETEMLVEAALSCLACDRPVRVLDLGTGSGAVALAIASDRPNASVLASDRSETALDIARANAGRLGLANVEFLRCDWYDGLPEGRFDVIVSNPPYVGSDDPHLARGDLRFEPRIALTPGGTDALAALKAIVLGARRHMEPGGALAVEHGYDQSEAVQGLFAAAGFRDIRMTRDLAGIPRVVMGRDPKN